MYKGGDESHRYIADRIFTAENAKGAECAGCALRTVGETVREAHPTYRMNVFHKDILN